MPKTNKWELSKQQQKSLTEALTQELVLLRAKLGISQAELSKLIGVSRQTYSAVENGYREMSWNTYLALLCFFDNNSSTRQMLRQTKAYPNELIAQFNGGKLLNENTVNSIAGIPASITENLDAEALHAIRTAVMVEYTRCTRLPAEDVVRVFEGVSLSPNGQIQEDRMSAAFRQLEKKY